MQSQGHKDFSPVKNFLLSLKIYQTKRFTLIYFEQCVTTAFSLNEKIQLLIFGKIFKMDCLTDRKVPLFAVETRIHASASPGITF